MLLGRESGLVVPHKLCITIRGRGDVQHWWNV